MSKKLAAELAELKNRYHVGLDDLTPDEIAALVHACERWENPFTSTNLALVEKPVEVCKGVVLWPPTAGAQIWLDEFAEKWWPEDSMRYRWAQIYALINARNPDAFANLTEKPAAWRAIVQTSLRLCVHRRELLKAIRAAYGVDEWEAPKRRINQLTEAAQTDFARMVTRLEVESGIPRKAWIWEHSFMETVRAYAEMHVLIAIAAGGGERADNLISELDEATNNLARVKKAIWLRLKEKDNGSGK
ncbi:MAG: hypothetical protein ACI4Q3_00605 [Kiritimatiellia bacterium]